MSPPRIAPHWRRWTLGDAKEASISELLTCLALSPGRDSSYYKSHACVFFINVAKVKYFNHNQLKHKTVLYFFYSNCPSLMLSLVRWHWSGYGHFGECWFRDLFHVRSGEILKSFTFISFRRYVFLDVLAQERFPAIILPLTHCQLRIVTMNMSHDIRQPKD